MQNLQKISYSGAIILLFSLAVATLLIGVPNSSSQLPLTLIPFLLGLAVLLIVIAAIFYRRFKARITELENLLEQSRKELEETRLAGEQIIEKRTFEISVINASLNREIAERMQTEREARDLLKQFELILNSAGEGILGLDTLGNFIFVNKAAALMVGWDKDELIGKSHHDLVHHSHADGSPHDPQKCLIRQAYKDGIVHFSSQDVFWTKEGVAFPVEYVSTPIKVNGTIKGAVVVFRDKSTFI